jgi:hypothetical protein
VSVHKDEISGVRKVVITQRTEEKLAAISEMDVETRALIRKIHARKDGSFTLELHSPLNALALLGKHVGMWPKERKQFSRRGNINVGNEPLVYVDAPPAETAEEWEARQARRFATKQAAGDRVAKDPAGQPSH